MASRTQKILIVAAVLVLGGFAVAGFVVGAGVYGWRAAKRAGNEAATIQNLKTIGARQFQYFNDHNRSFGTFEQLVAAQLLPSRFAINGVTADGYMFRMNVTPATPNSESTFQVTADPRDESSGRNHFYFDSKSVTIHVNPDQTAGPDDPSLIES